MEKMTFQKIISMNKMSDVEKHGVFMRNNEHYNFSAAEETCRKIGPDESMKSLEC